MRGGENEKGTPKFDIDLVTEEWPSLEGEIFKGFEFSCGKVRKWLLFRSFAGTIRATAVFSQ